MRASLAMAGAVTALLLPVLNACFGATADRQGPNGTQPDSYQDATHVRVYRNADQVPNVATFCLGSYGWASTLKNTTSDSASGSAAPSLVRFPELDTTCKGA
jgi:hypothetical protein